MSEKSNIDKNSSSLADVILVIVSHIKFLLLITIISVILTVFFVQKEFIPKYTSESVLFIPKDNSGSNFSNIANQFGLGSANTVQDISSAALYPHIVESRTFAARLLQREIYTERYDQKLPLLAILTYGTGEPTIGLDTLISNVSKAIPLFVKFTKKTPFIVLNVITKEPQFSQNLAIAVLEELDKIQREFKSQKVVETINYIEQKIDIAKIELERLEEGLKDFREANRRIDASPTLILLQDRLQRDVEIQQGIFLTLKQQLELAKIDEVQKKSFVQVLDLPSLPLKISNPPKLSSYILGGLAGLFIGLCIIFIVEYFTNRNSSEAQKLKSAKLLLTKDIKRIFRKKRV